MKSSPILEFPEKRKLSLEKMQSIKGGDTLPVSMNLGERTGQGTACAGVIYGYGTPAPNQCYHWEYDTRMPDGTIQYWNVSPVNLPC